MGEHAVYPDGPPCQPNCPGEYSMYHDGYADGYENAENALAADLRAQVEALPNPHSSLDPGERNGFNDCRAAVLALLSQRNTQEGRNE